MNADETSLPLLPLHVKYRPDTLKGLVGQGHVTSSLRKLLKDNPPHAYLFLGPSGVGKTTTARIVAASVGCSGNAVIEINAAQYNGVEEMRTIIDASRYRAMGDSPNKFFIIDECHTLSKQAWQPLLKATEEPPPHLFWAFCTTEAAKVPDTIRTRCHAYELKPVNSAELCDLLTAVAAEEGIEVGDDVLQLCAKEAGGSPRQALVNLSMVRYAKDRQDAYRTLASSLTDEEGVGVKLARALIAGTTWRDAIGLVRRLPDEETAESVRLIVVNYAAKALTDAKDDRRVERMLAVLEVFSHPFYGAEKRAPLLLAIGKLVYG